MLLVRVCASGGGRSWCSEAVSSCEERFWLARWSADHVYEAFWATAELQKAVLVC